MLIIDTIAQNFTELKFFGHSLLILKVVKYYKLA